jgi:outer membrane protein
MKNILLVSFIFAISVFGDVIGLEAGAAYWKPTALSNVNFNGRSIDLQKDLGHSDKQNSMMLWASIEHPIPIAPNIKITHNSLSQSKDKTITKSIVFSGKTYSANSKVSSEFTLNQTDVILYYELLDNIVELDFGLDIKYIKTDISIKSKIPIVDESKDLSFAIPLGYLKAKVNFDFIPFLSGLSLGAEGSYLKIGKNKFLDYKTEVAYSKKLVVIDVGAVVGYKTVDITVDVDDKYAQLKYSGPYLGMFLHF